MTATIFSSKNNQWRESYNPLRGLTFARVVAMLDAGERGQYSDLQWFYYFMERSDPVIFTVLQRRRAALMECDWDIRQAPGVERQAAGGDSAGKGAGAREQDTALADEQVACLREVYDGIGNFREAVGFLFTGFSRGFAHLEKHWNREGRIERLEPVEQWFWVRDGMFGPWQYNRDAVSSRIRGESVNLDNFVILETIPMNRILCLLYLRRVLGNRNWDAYLDVFGIPPVFLIGPPNAGSDKEKEYQAIADELFSNGRGYLPNGSDIKYVNAGGGRAPYRELVEYLDKQITLVGTGGLLTMLTEAGSGTLAGGAHSDTFQQIARGDAAAVSEVFQRAIDLPVLKKAFPGRPALAYFQLAPNDAGQTPAAVAQDAAALAAAGFIVDPAQLAEKTGYRQATSAPAAPIMPASPAGEDAG